MELKQIRKQVDWLDDERRKDNTRISSLEERINSLEDNVAPLSTQIMELSSEITRLSALITRMDGFDEGLLKTRVEIKQQVEAIEKQLQKRDDEIDRKRRDELRPLEKTLSDLRKEMEIVPDIQRNLSARVEEEVRLSRAINDANSKIEDVRRSEEEYTRSFLLLDDGRRQDAKRLTDLQGEVAAIRKRLDNQRGQLELANSNLKKYETRLNEMVVVETERREAANSFLESQSMKEIERERVWKEWQSRFELIESQTVDIENNLQTLDSTQRSIKRTQQAADELSQKVERRINELTEIQRLAEERFRQEWVTFKGDDQKRWTNYTLTLEEQRSEALRQHDVLNDKVTHIEDELQEFQDILYQMNELTEKRLQTLLSITHEWVSSYERSVGRSR